MAKFSFQLNGRAVTVDSWDPAQPLLYVLRNSLGLHGPKFGCGLAQCGACTVLIDGKAVRSCVTPVRQAAGHAITTLEGLGTPEKPDAVQAAFIAEQAAQCGYCTNGMIMTVEVAAQADTPSDARASQASAGRKPVPLRHAHADSARRDARGQSLKEVIMATQSSISRRDLLKAGALV